MAAVFPHQAQAVHARQDQILQDDRGPGLDRHAQGLVGIRAVVEVDVALRDQRAPDGFADHDLIVNEQHHCPVRIQIRRSRAVYGREHSKSLISA
ncbi:hypothetical protein D3C71_1653420 [compost metagenome]